MNYDIIVVGGGHAGIEACLASARMGKKTLLITILAEQIGATSCNPAVGGLAKGHLVKEVDALGGQIGLAADKNGIQFRILNESKGPAVQGSRAQIDMDSYRVYMKNILLNQKNLDISQEIVTELLVKNDCIYGLKTQLLNTYFAKSIILTTGTFLNGLIHTGEIKQEAGRVGEFASTHLSQNLKSLGLKIGRLKTGTCPRIDAKSIDFSNMEKQDGDIKPKPFSFRTNIKDFNPIQLPCYITYTSGLTHEIIEKNFYRAPMFTGQIEGIGPRYCPSIEDKINRFRDKERHHLFIEPQTLNATEYYINGLSTSLPPDVQKKMISTISGLENAKIVRYGYAIEYDYLEPTELKHSLETKKISGLFCAGQINGSTGYEEAAAQGIIAGINASLALDKKDPLILKRDEAYIGVLIDDLVTKGAKEPYRMFTSRAEYRLLLREDNADLRLMKYGYELGLVDEDTYKTMKKKEIQTKEGLELLESTFLTPSNVNIEFLTSIGEEKINEKTSLQKIVSRKSFTIEKLDKLSDIIQKMSHEAKNQILINAKYKNYIEKQADDIAQMEKMLDVKIPNDIDFSNISGLSKEVCEKLSKFNPPTLYAASQISGITPAALDILHIHIKMQLRKK